MFCLEVSSKCMLNSISREGCELFHFIYCIKKKSVQRHCTYFFRYSWPWLHYLWNKIGCRLVDWCWLVHTERQWNLFRPIKPIWKKSTVHVWTCSVRTIIFRNILWAQFYSGKCSPWSTMFIENCWIRFWENNRFVFQVPFEGTQFLKLEC
jgi:hypothetical protein